MSKVVNVELNNELMLFFINMCKGNKELTITVVYSSDCVSVKNVNSGSSISLFPGQNRISALYDDISKGLVTITWEYENIDTILNKYYNITKSTVENDLLIKVFVDSTKEFIKGDFKYY